MAAYGLYAAYERQRPPYASLLPLDHVDKRQSQHHKQGIGQEERQVSEEVMVGQVEKWKKKKTGKEKKNRKRKKKEKKEEGEEEKEEDEE